MKPRHTVLGLGDGRVHIVPEAEVERQPRRGAPVVLHVEGRLASCDSSDGWGSGCAGSWPASPSRNDAKVLPPAPPAPLLVALR